MPIQLSQIQLLGHLVGNGVIKPDPECFAALNDLPAPTTKRVAKNFRSVQLLLQVGTYCNYSGIIRLLVHADSFPLSEAAWHAFRLIKNKLGSATLQPIDENIPFLVETVASDFAIAATLNQNNKPVAFNARTLSTTERRLSSVEKEPFAVIEALRKWKHLLAGKHFNLITDQRKVSFMLDLRHSSKIKNDKIQVRRLELASFDFRAIYRPGSLNSAPDIFFRATSASVSLLSLNSLTELHISLCHPGITRLAHYVKVKNLPFSLDAVKTVTKACKDCSEIKASFHKPKDDLNLTKATQPFERVSLDFRVRLIRVHKTNTCL